MPTRSLAFLAKLEAIVVFTIMSHQYLLAYSFLMLDFLSLSFFLTSLLLSYSFSSIYPNSLFSCTTV